MTTWLLDSRTLAELRHVAERLAYDTGSADTLAADFQRRAVALQKDGKGTTIIDVIGPLTNAPSRLLAAFGAYTSYSSIRNAIAAANADPATSQIVLSINSPGGSVDGLFETVGAIRASTKPVFARATSALSAAYALAASCRSIDVVGDWAEVGSVGVATTYFLDPLAIDITSSNAPAKRPDPTTEAGRKVITKHLDDIHALFVEVIAQGRRTTPKKVNADFGKGAVLLAREALKVGMIDRIAGRPDAIDVGVEQALALRSGRQVAAWATGEFPTMQAVQGEIAKRITDAIAGRYSPYSHPDAQPSNQSPAPASARVAQHVFLDDFRGAK